ncbi:hypothetical protein AX15_001048 [Amanita polypyramis BW_CC]|nr:hypothetical protein AX15_001048 [Amanita polypyramis BW_CC]
MGGRFFISISGKSERCVQVHLPPTTVDMRGTELSFDENENQTVGDGRGSKTKRPTPLPLVQLFIVYLIQFSEPVSATVIYPFINQFVGETGITRGDERRTGYYAGILQSAFFLAEAATVVGWGVASDRFGRRPTLLIGPLGLSIVMLSFGMSSNFWCLVLFRFLQGIFNGNIGISKSIIGELTDSTNMADAFAGTSMMWSVGVMFGPILGGILSGPAARWPRTLGKLRYLRQHPYFPPCLVASLIAFLSFLCGFIALNETSPAAIQVKEKKKMNKLAGQTQHFAPNAATPLAINNGTTTTYGTSERSTPLDLEQGVHDKDPNPPTLQALLTPEVVTVIINYGFSAFLEMSFQVLIPLVWSTSVGLGGLGFTPYNIGLTMGIYGLASALVQICFLGRFIRRFGPRKVYRVAFSCQLVCFLGFPIASFLSRHAGKADWIVWCVIGVQLTAGIVAPAAYGAMQVIIQGVAPNRSSLGAMNGLAQCVASASRSLAPSMTSSLYAVSLQRRLAGGNAVYYILLVIIACGIKVSFTLPKKLRLQ